MSTIIELIILAVITAMVACFSVLLMEKLEIREFLKNTFDEQGNEFMYKLWSCDFCLCFWISVLASVPTALILEEAWYLVIPFISTPIARRFL